MLMWCHLFYWQLWPVYLSSSVLAVFVRGKCKYWKWKVMFFYEASCLMVCVCARHFAHTGKQNGSYSLCRSCGMIKDLSDLSNLGIWPAVLPASHFFAITVTVRSVSALPRTIPFPCIVLLHLTLSYMFLWEWAVYFPSVGHVHICTEGSCFYVDVRTLING